MLCAVAKRQKMHIGRDAVRIMEKYSRGRRGAPAKGVGRATGARVQIPLSPFHLSERVEVEVLISTLLFLPYKEDRPAKCCTSGSETCLFLRGTCLGKLEKRCAGNYFKIRLDKLENSMIR